MKKISLYIMSALAVSAFSTSCTDMLMVESKTDITTDYIYSTADGLSRAVVGLYYLDREVMIENSGANAAIWLMDPGTDTSLMRGGDGALIFRCNTNTSATEHYASWWQYFYQIIGKANEIIAAAEGDELDLDDSVVLQSWAEAKVFRAKTHFELYKRFENIILSTEPTTIDNIDRTFEPAEPADIFELINQDLQDVIDADALSWEPISASTGNTDYGRFTMAVVRHLKAQAAMWEEKYTEAIAQFEAIAERTEVGLMPSTIDCFWGADLNVMENLYVMQFGATIGGAEVSDGAYNGHRICRYTIPSTDEHVGAAVMEYGGLGWGRCYANSYCRSLYKDGDVRYDELFRREWEWQDGDVCEGQLVEIIPGSEQASGRETGDDGVYTNRFGASIRYFYPQPLKYHDQWTMATTDETTRSHKDIVVYRLAETYLIAAEAYMREGNQTKALECYNAIYGRSNATPFSGTLTMDEIIDEYARELHMEGVRFALLKRMDYLDPGTSSHWTNYMSWNERVQTYGGDTAEDSDWVEYYADPTSGGYAIQRANFPGDSEKQKMWPIPLEELDLMIGYPQNPGW